MINRTPLTDKPLHQPNPPAKKMVSMFDRGKPCLTHQVAFTGREARTGALRCQLCLTTWNSETGELLEIPSRVRKMPTRGLPVVNPRNGTE